ncbi:MAG TPA: PIN domain-containing protein [Burkholderiaceae bacterium]
MLLYAQDPREPHKREACSLWLARCWREKRGRISTQVLNEFYVNVRRVAPAFDVRAARDLVRQYRAWSPWTVDDTTVDLAWLVQDRVGYSYWDSLMVAAAQQQGCAYLLTEDLEHGQQVDGVRILNPFKVGPDVLDGATA